MEVRGQRLGRARPGPGAPDALRPGDELEAGRLRRGRLAHLRRGRQALHGLRAVLHPAAAARQRFACWHKHCLTRRVLARLACSVGRPRARRTAPDVRAGLRGVVAHVDAGHGEPHRPPAHARGEAAAVHDAGRPIEVAAAAAPRRQPALLRLRAAGARWSGCCPGRGRRAPTHAHLHRRHISLMCPLRHTRHCICMQDVDARSHINNNQRHESSGDGVTKAGARTPETYLQVWAQASGRATTVPVQTLNLAAGGADREAGVQRGADGARLARHVRVAARGQVRVGKAHGGQRHARGERREPCAQRRRGSAAARLRAAPQPRVAAAPCPGTAGQRSAA